MGPSCPAQASELILPGHFQASKRNVSQSSPAELGASKWGWVGHIASPVLSKPQPACQQAMLVSHALTEEGTSRAAKLANSTARRNISLIAHLNTILLSKLHNSPVLC